MAAPTSSSASGIRSIVCDPRPLARAGLMAVLGRVGPVQALGPAEFGPALAAGGFDVAVVGVCCESDGRFDPVITAAGEHGVPCVAVLDRLDEVELRAAVVSGASGIVPGDAALATLVDVVARVRIGERVLPRIPVADEASAASGVDRALRPVELRVLELMADGLTNEAIAEELGIAARTVKTHVQNLIVRLAARDRTSTVARALRLGLIR